MANQEHLDILKQGVKVWNEWRDKDYEIRPDLSRANLIGANLIGADLIGANLIGADLIGADLSHSSLSDATLSEADLSGAYISDANLNGADLSSAYLGSADLSGAYLYRAMFKNTGFDDTKFSKAIAHYSSFDDCDFSGAIGLDSVVHHGPSSIGIDTLYKSGGNIPESFLRGCGVPDTFITFAKSLIGKAIDYYSAFISYSSKNTDIAERLYADLQSKGVRCWFAPEDLKIGDKFRQRIDEAIRIHDKLLLILSEDSMASSWVEDEVEAALEREHRENRLVLFPLRIDDAIEQSTIAWAASLRRTRHIGDFSRWKVHDSYIKVFERLLRDLKAEGKV